MKKEWSENLESEWKRQCELLERGVVEITPLEEFREMVKKSLLNNKPLRVKCGIDPTSADVHLGHLVPYRKMRQFQDLGHIGVVIIGDYTAQIGDPTGKNETRPSLDAEQVKINAKKYMDQLFSVLDEKKTEIRYQSEWFSKVGLKEILGWAGQTTVGKLLSHDTFRVRIEEGHPLGLHELFYPVLQGIDSVFIEADVELGGSEQKFNVLMGRDFQKHKGMRPQVAMLMPLIIGLCGTQKMSKSLNNYIGVLDEPFDKFGKIMSIPDTLMIDYFRYVAFMPPHELLKVKAGLENGEAHPNETKKNLASWVVAFFHGEDVAVKMREQFENVFAKGKVPDEIEEYSFSRGENLVEALVKSLVLKSKGEVKRLLVQNAISFVDSGEKLKDEHFKLEEEHSGKVIKVGKRIFLKLK